MTYHAKVIAGGKIVIPAELRRELGIKDGDSVVIERDEHGQLILKSYSQVVKEVQAAFRAMRKPGIDYRGAIDELIAERRAEADAEDAAAGRQSGHE